MKRYVGGLLLICIILNWYTKNTMEQSKKLSIIKVAQQANSPKKG